MIPNTCIGYKMYIYFVKRNDVNSSNDGFKNILYQILDTFPLNETKHKCIQQQCSKMGRDMH